MLLPLRSISHLDQFDIFFHWAAQNKLSIQVGRVPQGAVEELKVNSGKGVFMELQLQVFLENPVVTRCVRLKPSIQAGRKL